MKSLKYLAIIGALCVGLTTFARASVIDLGEANPADNSEAAELEQFILAGGDADAFACFRITESSGIFTLSVNPDDTLHVEWDATGFSFLICGFATKDGGGNLIHLYSVSPDQQVIGSGDLIVPANGADSLSHLTVFCCPGGVPDGGATVMLLGAGLGALGMVRRYLKS
jgi:VPDSG-CTERM motif